MTPHFLRTSSIVFSAILLLVTGGIASAQVYINEIMYRPAGVQEDTGLEFLELRNAGSASVDISAWALSKGVAFTFPAGTILPAGGYIVVAADLAKFAAQHPGVTNVAGPWAGTLSNSGEEITLVDNLGMTQNSVAYASEGEWAQRAREATFGGWDWATLANGGGRSLELRNSGLGNKNGQRWGASTVAGGTPGSVNSVVLPNIAPVIKDVKHSPAVPRPGEPVTVSCKLEDETPATEQATLFWRNASTVNPGPFTQVPMSLSGTSYSVTLPGEADKTIVEFYVQATDGGLTRTWPAPSNEGQNTNCAWQVNSEAFNSTDPYYLLVLTAAENAAFDSLAASNPNSDRVFHTTFVSVRGSGSTIRYNSGMRIRGNSSRSYQFKPMRITLPSDNRWDGVTDFNLNPKASFLQFMGFRSLQAAGVRAGDAIPVRVRRNGIDYTTSGGSTPDYGRWVRVEELGTDMTDRHWPEAKGGNAYKKGRPDRFWRSTAAAPTNPDASLDGWLKQGNKAANDWSDLTNFFQTWQAAAAPHFPSTPAGDVSDGAGQGTSSVGSWNGTAFTAQEITSIETVCDLDQWARWFAIMTILQSNETNLSNGQDDDYSVYFAPGADGHRRMNLLPHDLDTIFGLGDSQLAANARGLYDMTDDGSLFRSLLPLLGNNSTAGNAAFRQKYHDSIRHLYGTVFNADTTGNPYPPFYAFLDNHLSGWAPAATITSMKNFATARQAHLLGLIGSGAATPPAATSASTVTSPPGGIRISEVLARNVSAFGLAGTFPDFIEIQNATPSPVNVGGMSLTDDPAVPAKYVIPAGTVIEGNEYLTIFADNNAATPGLHAGFQLDQDGDQVRLYQSAAAGGAVVDSVTFGPQAADLSISRTGTESDVWALTVPTPDSENSQPVTLGAVGGVRINEVFSNPDYLFADDFVELYNPASSAVAIGGTAITDDFINYPSRHTFPALSFIGPGGFLTLRPKGDSASPGNPTELPFKLSSFANWSALIGQNGTIIDQFDTLSQAADVSRGRLPDGGSAIVNFTLPGTPPTPGTANVAPPSSILSLLNQLRVTELLYKPSHLEYVELQNIGSTDLELLGVRFTGGIEYTFSQSTILGPHQFIVICRDRTAFTTQFGTAARLADGVFTGVLDNSGETVTLQTPTPYDLNILRFRYEPTWYPESDLEHSLIIANPETPARDWDERETWIASNAPFGTPGIGLPPTLKSAGSADGIVGSAFSFQIAATQLPTSYSATGLPDGISIDTQTGLISGTPTSGGTYNVTVGVSNGAGSDSGQVVFFISAFGPLAGFQWNAIPAQTAGLSFSPTLRAVDSVGRTVTSFGGQATVAARRPINAPKLVFTEFGTSTPTPDYFEIQNVGQAPENTSGWFVLTNRSSQGVNSALATRWDLPASVAAGQILGATDGTPSTNETAYGADIDWAGVGPSGWAMLVDNSGTIRDFVVWGYSAAQIATINLTHSGFTLTAAGQWTGDGTSTIPAGQSLFRSGTTDNNTSSDWAVAATPSPRGQQNAALTVPWVTAFATISSSISSPVTLVNGIWSEGIALYETTTQAELQADLPGYPLVRSNTFIINQSNINTPPRFTKGPDQSVFEDSGSRTISSWASSISPGNPSESSQAVTFTVTSDNPSLFAVAPSLSSSGTLTFTPAANANGSATVTVVAKDNGGTANGGVDTSAPQTFTITVNAVNDPPTITAGPNITASQGAIPQSITAWATGITAGPVNESAQTLQISLIAADPTLFMTQPALSTEGVLTFTPTELAVGSTTVTATVTDNGGTANGGVNFAQRSFSITIVPANRPPRFTPGGNINVGAKTGFSAGWATSISAIEPGQSITFIVNNDRPDLFSVQPTITPSGQLTFGAGKSPGIASITVRAKDNGGTANGGQDTSAPVVFTVQITSSSALAGTHRALIHAPAGQGETTAKTGLAQFTITSAGRFTGSVSLGGQRYPVSGAFDNGGSASFGRKGAAFSLPRKGLTPLLLTMHANLMAAAPRITGEIADGPALFGEFSAERDAYHAKLNPVPSVLLDKLSNNGKFTAAFEAQPAPNGGLEASRYPAGDGYALISVTKSGGVSLVGKLADGTVYTYQSGLNSANGFPLYLPLYKKLGAIAGTVSFDIAGDPRVTSPGLSWYRPAQLLPKPSKQYAEGWPNGISVGVTGSARNAVSEREVLPIGAANLVLSGGNTDSVTVPFSIAAKNKVSMPNNPVKAIIGFKSSGEWTGSFVHPVTGKRTAISGVVLRHRNAASGFFIGSNQAGRATISVGP